MPRNDGQMVTAALATYAKSLLIDVDPYILVSDMSYLYRVFQQLKKSGQLNWKQAQNITGISSQRLYRYFYETIEYQLAGTSMTNTQKWQIESACEKALSQDINIWKNKKF